MSDLIDVQKLRQIGASAIVGLQEAVGVRITYLDALKLWDAITPEKRRQVLKSYELMYSEGDYVILDPQVKQKQTRTDLNHSDNQNWVRFTFRDPEETSPNGIELSPVMKIDLLD